MHARDDDPAFAEHDRGERFRAANGGSLADARVCQDRVVLLDRGGKNDQIRHRRRLLPDAGEKKRRPSCCEPIRLEGARLVRSTHFMPELEKERGDSAHPAAGDADQMDRVPLLGEEFLKVDLRRRRVIWLTVSFHRFDDQSGRVSSARARSVFPTCVRRTDGIARSNREFFAQANRPRARLPAK